MSSKIATSQNPGGRSALVIGAGAFGLSAACELLNRGWNVTVLESGPFPHPDAASNDISKIVRMDYGADEFYSTLGEQAIEAWLAWNREWDWRPFHQDGFLIMAPSTMEPGGFEYESFQVAVKRGRRVERLSDPSVRARYPAWSAGDYPDGYVNLDGGWSPSGRVIEHLQRTLIASGVPFEIGTAVGVDPSANGPCVALDDGRTLAADRVVIASGSWTTTLLPELSDRVWASGQPVFHYKLDDPSPFQAPAFIPWAAGTATTGWYGFPALDDGTLKVSNHGPGRVLDPHEPREVEALWDDRFSEFLARTLPGVVGAPVVKKRLCVYTDTFDSDFLIDQVPDRPGVVVATGGSGHGYKFAPVLGAIIADAVEERANPASARFGWREASERRIEPARFAG